MSSKNIQIKALPRRSTQYTHTNDLKLEHLSCCLLLTACMTPAVLLWLLLDPSNPAHLKWGTFFAMILLPVRSIPVRDIQGLEESPSSLTTDAPPSGQSPPVPTSPWSLHCCGADPLLYYLQQCAPPPFSLIPAKRSGLHSTFSQRPFESNNLTRFAWNSSHSCQGGAPVPCLVYKPGHYASLPRLFYWQHTHIHKHTHHS